MPSMPSVSMPSVGSGFYSPGRSDFYNPNLNRNQNASSQTTNSSANSANVSENESATSATSTTAQNQASALKAAQNLNSLAKSTSSAFNGLSADDISSMSNLGVFNQISGLLGRGTSLLKNPLSETETSAITNTLTANTADSDTLKQILSELTSLKNQMNADSESEKAADGSQISPGDKSAGKNAFSNIVKKEPKILRFIVNGYDILQTCKKIYFSDLEADGTFLLTGDRKYMSENKSRSETFYFYFHANGSENGITKYTVTPAVSQDYENEYSYLYQLTQKDALTANRTGNLVTLRVKDGDWNMDLLLSLDR